MLRAFGPGCGGKTVDATAASIPAKATWIDLENPTSEEEALVERCIGVDVPTSEEMKEIEPSSRLYERDGALYMTVATLTGVTEGEPRTAPIAFVLTPRHLVTLRYSSPKPVHAFAEQAAASPALVRQSTGALIKLLDALIDRVADELEELGEEIEVVSKQIFDRKIEARRISADKLTALLTRIGLAQTLLAKIRFSAVSTRRMLNFLAGSQQLEGAKNAKYRDHIASLATDVSALSEHANFQADYLIFQLDACLGLISVEQNAAMKLFSWVAAVFLPPSVVAGFFGMNFHFFPELDWPGGAYTGAVIMLASAVLPYLYFRWRRWI